jgi:hypothetical protein
MKRAGGHNPKEGVWVNLVMAGGLHGLFAAWSE